MNFFLKLFILTLLIDSNAFAEKLECNDSIEANKLVKSIDEIITKQKVCPNDSGLYQLCYLLEKRQPSSNPIGNNRYEYQDIIFKAACVNSSDGIEEIKSKISAMWDSFDSQLVCDIPSFNVANGSIIKFGICSRFDTFIDNVIRWNVNLNKIDPVDGNTVLDYLKIEIENSKGLTSEAKLKSYYTRLMAAGARHKKDLPIKEIPKQ